MYGQSALRRYELGAQQPAQIASLGPELFAEGICLAGDHLWQLTWQERVALRWDPQTMELLDTVPYNREGWGICAVGEHVVTSDGSSELVWRDSETLSPPGIIRVRHFGERLDGLNDRHHRAGRPGRVPAHRQALALPAPRPAGRQPPPGPVPLSWP